MSYFATIDGVPAEDVATNSGWRDFCEWVRGFPAKELNHLADYGWSDNWSLLKRELSFALERGHPTADQSSIGTGLLDVLANHKSGDVLVVSDGIGEGNEQDES